MGLTRPRLGQFQTTTAAFDDPIVVFNNNASGSNSKDIGIVFERGDDQNKVLLWDESADEFVLANSTEQGSTSGDVALVSYANLHINDLIAEGTITMKGNVVLGDATTDTITFNGEYTFPSEDGTANQVLSTDGSGNLSFVDVATTLDEVTANGNTTTNGISVSTLTTSSTITSAGAIAANATGNSITVADTLRIAETGSGLRMTNVGAFDNNSGKFRIFGTGNLQLLANGESGQGIEIASSGYGITFNNAFTFPTSDGTANQVLETDGSGTLSWTDVATTLDEVTANGNTTTNSISVGTITASGNIIPSAADTYSLGTPTLRFSELYVSNNTIYIGDTALSVVSGSLYVNGAPVVNQGDAYPGYDGDYDMAKALAQTTAETPFESGGQDAFGVDLSLVFDNMDPSGQTITYDFADQYSGGSADGSPESYLGA